MRVASLFTVIIVYAASLLAQHPYASSAEAGRAQFQKKCASCHGENAKGGRAPDLTSGSWRHGGTEEDLIRNITQGIPNTQMPPFPMPREEAQSIIAFLRAGKALNRFVQRYETETVLFLDRKLDRILSNLL